MRNVDARLKPGLVVAAAAFNRRQFLRGIATLMAVCGFGTLGCEESRPLKISIQPWCGYQFLVLARHQGWLRSERIALHSVSLASESVALLKSGDVDAAALTLDEVVRLRDEGLALSVVMIFDVSVGADVLLVKPEIGHLSALKGKRIGVEDSGLAKIMLAKLMEEARLAADHLQLVTMDSDHLQAWRSQQLDAILTYEPALSRLQREEGLLRLFDSHNASGLIINVLAVRRDKLVQHETALRELIAGHFRALELWYMNPIDTAYRLSMSLGVSSEEVRLLFQGLDLPDVIYNRQNLTPPASDLQQAAQNIAGILAGYGITQHPFNGEHLFTADYLPGDRG